MIAEIASAAAPKAVLKVVPDARPSRCDAWEAKLDPKAWEIERRRTIGSFQTTLAHALKGGDRRGCVATKDGALEDVVWSEILAGEHDVDRDGRDDLVLTVTKSKGIEPLVIADRKEGPMKLPIEGLSADLEPQALRVYAKDKHALELFVRDTEPDHQVLAWNGKALASKELTFIHMDCETVEHSSGQVCRYIAVGNGGRLEGELDRGQAVDFDVFGETDFDLAGDGSLFWWVRLKPPMTPDNLQAEGEHTIEGLHLGAKGWEHVDLPYFFPGTLLDRDGDKIPELAVRAGDVELASCANIKDCTTPTLVLTALETWTGKEFSGQEPRLRGAYAKRDRSKPNSTCGFDAVEPAVEIYLAARWSGASEADAILQLDAAMAKASYADCPPGKPRPWSAVRAQIVKELKLHVPK